MPRLLLVLLGTFAALTAPTLTASAEAAGDPAEVEAVRTAVVDYVEAFYQADPERLKRSVEPRLTKIGWTRAKDGEDGAFREHPRTFDQLLEGARRYNRTGWLPNDAPKEITVYDVLDKVASAKLVAHWGIDYLHLAKIDGRWMIIHVVWQDLPPAE
ncbi:MAG: nuclear transport factor 2 family protein [Acidobacteriota bacterium]